MTDSSDDASISRRNILVAGLGAAAAAVLAACGRGGEGGSGNGTPSGPAAQGGPTTTAAPVGGGAAGSTLAPTPECADEDDVTPSQTAGPYFKASSPERTDIRGDAGGTRLLLTGTVVTTACTPLSRALVDFWQADGSGNYDNSGFRFRGHQFTDAEGRYHLETVLPGLYPGRARHIHVKVQPPGGRVLTTQLYFPGEAGNASDGLFREECVVQMSDAANGRNGAFTFVLDT